MTANLLAHSDLFAAGIAESGAYNRTLTPFGFQSRGAGPLARAGDLHRHVTLHVRGQDQGAAPPDPRPGRQQLGHRPHPERALLCNALKGNGATARLVVLPFESHGYRARESVLHLLWESANWLDTYVKNRPAEGMSTR